MTGSAAGPTGAVCRAPWVNLYLAPDGQVRMCCRNAVPVGYIGERSLREIWDGADLAATRSALAVGRFEGGCGACGQEVAIEGRTQAYPAVFDEIDPVDDVRWPARIEFNLSNACNLACVQCNGDLSSSVRIHRERRPRLPEVYGDAFFAEIVDFLGHLRSAQFAGGEPFLAEENYRLWDLVARHRPDLPLTVVTNATRWDDRVERVAHGLHMGFALSIDSVEQTEYEAIRHGADFHQVMANVDRYAAAAQANGRPITLNWCLMAQNVTGLPAVLRFAEERGIGVDVSVVRDPESCSVMALDHDERRRVVAELERRDDEMSATLVRNARVWRAELARLRGWAGIDDETAAAARSTFVRTVLGLPVQGDGPHRAATVVDELRAAHPDRGVHWIEVNAWDDIVAADDGIAAVTTVAADQLVGWNLIRLGGFTARAFAPTGDQVVGAAGVDRIDLVQPTERGDLGVTLVADRDEAGRSTGGRLVFVLPPPTVSP